MKIRVINIAWQSAPKTLPASMVVELENDTPREDWQDQVKYALWRATGVTPVSFEIVTKL